MLLRLLPLVPLVLIQRAAGVPAPARVADPHYLLREVYQGPVDNDDPALGEYRSGIMHVYVILRSIARVIRLQRYNYADVH